MEFVVLVAEVLQESCTEAEDQSFCQAGVGGSSLSSCCWPGWPAGI